MSDESPARSRSSRRTRVRGRTVRLRDRDVDVLLALAKMRLLKTSDLGRLYFGAVGTCQKRMRKLYDAGLVRAIAPDLAAENRYALTPLGHAFLMRAHDGNVPAYRAAPRVDGRSLAHLDLMNRYRIALATGAVAHGVELRSFVPEWELRASDPEARIIPDALFVLAANGRAVAVALEVDTGAEPPATVRRKVENYGEREMLRGDVFGVRAPHVLFIASSPRRAASLARAVVEVDGRILFGAPPMVLDGGGVARGLSRAGELAKAAAPGLEVFASGLASLLAPR